MDAGTMVNLIVGGVLSGLLTGIWISLRNKVSKADCDDRRQMCGMIREGVSSLIKEHSASLKNLNAVLNQHAVLLARLDERVETLLNKVK